MKTRDKGEVAKSPPLHSAKLESAEVQFGDQTFTIVHQDPDDHIFKILKSSGRFYESEMLEALRRVLEPGDIVVDVGANIGNHTVFFAGVCGCQVIAFEPHPLAFALLNENIRINSLQPLVVANMIGVGQATGSATFEPMASAHNLGGSTLRIGGQGIKVAPLDDLLAGKSVRLLKIDVEGMELSVLKGAKRMLRKARPMVCVEAKEEVQFGEIFDFLSAYGLFVGSVHNFSATHLFFRSGLFKQAPILSALSRFLGMFFIRSETGISELRRRVASLEDRVSALSQGDEPKL